MSIWLVGIFKNFLSKSQTITAGFSTIFTISSISLSFCSIFKFFLLIISLILFCIIFFLKSWSIKIPFCLKNFKYELKSLKIFTPSSSDLSIKVLLELFMWLKSKFRGFLFNIAKIDLRGLPQ